MQASDPFRKAQFLISAPSLAQCPEETGAEVAFAGRSNAGKSSAINALTGNGRLARTSKTPGRTQLINFFSLGNELQRLVDLPGYGYAKVSRSVKQQWQEHLSEYLYHRTSLRGVVLLADIRHPLQPFDEMMLQWGAESALPVHLLLTKSDKLKRGPAKSALLSTRRSIAEQHPGAAISSQTFSAQTGDGLAQLKETLMGWLALPGATNNRP